MYLLKNAFLRKLFSRKSSEQNKLLESILGFRPADDDLYKLALRHRSVAKQENNMPLSNERLEFLGDAILTLVVSEYLYVHYPERKEGELTKMRTKLVNGFFLNELALHLKIDELLEAGIGENETPRSIYGDALEALIGAVYIDKGYAGAQEFILHRLIRIREREKELMSMEIDHKSKLIEWAQKTKVNVGFRVTDELNEDKKYCAKLYVENVEKTTGYGFTKKEAEQHAAKEFFDRNLEP